MEVENSGTGVSRLHMETENQRIDGIEAASGVSTVDECEQVHKMDCSEVVGPPAMVAGDSEVNGQEAPLAAEAETKAEVKVKGRGGGQKRKRGRPQRGQAKPPPSKKKREEEDVCFICFDGGNLVLCDRRGCPKAYHPACIKRDEAFFRSRARWNCGWHICNRCQKAAHYMCYTCTYSLCKGCTKDADYQCVRGNKGFCTTCMRTIMLIENNEQGNNETAQVDFDDKSSWEYLFKVYWIYLKEKLSLTLWELTQAKNPWNGAGVVACKGRPLDLNIGANDGRWAISDSSSGHLDTIGSKRRKTKEHPEFLNRDYLSGGDRGTKLIVCTEWASKELLDFVAYMNNGDRSVLSLLDVLALLHDYIKRNNLLDPQQKSKIICDFRLKTLFGKPCIDHSEMLKLLESHFHIKEDSKREAIWPTVQGGGVDAVAREVAADSYNDNLLMLGKDQSYKTSTKGEDKGLQMNVDDYAAIDVHNVNLIYMRRNLVESLIEDNEKFHDKVIGSIVRARISSSDQKQYIYKLVQVVGTSKAAVAYKLGERTTDIMLEILNLDKKEAISIDAISDQEFSKDECRCLRQNINHELVKRFTVGDIQKKAMALQRVKLDRLEKERWQLKHLCDQASKEGHDEQHRECVVKLQHLKTTEEQKRLHEIPEVHADLNMDPNYGSEEDGGESDMKQDQYGRPKYSEISRNGREASSPQKGGDISNDASGRAWKNSTTFGQSANICSAFYLDKKFCTRSEIKDSYGLDSAEKLGNQVDSADSVTDDGNNQSVGSGSCYGVASETSTVPPPTGMTPSLNDTEIDKLWHYRDLNGKIQGPFSMMQLRKWSTTGCFQPDQRIWGINDEENASLLLTDALEGHFQKPSCFLKNLSLCSPEVGVASNRKLYGFDCGGVGSMESTGVDSKQNDGRLNCNEVKPRSSSSNEFVRSNASGSHSSDWSTHVNYKDGQAGSPSQCWDSFKGDNSYQDDERLISDPSRGNWNSHKTSVVQISTKQSHENRSNSQGHSGQTSGQNWKSLPANFSSNNWESSSDFASKAKSTDSSEQNRETDFPNLPYHTPKTINGDWEGQVAENKQSVSMNAHDQDSHTADVPSHTPMSGNGDEKGQATENKQSLSSNFIVQDPSWSSASSLVVGSGVRLHEIADEWGGYSSTPAKPSAEEFESGLMSASSLKPPEAVGDHAATPTSNIDQFTHSSPSHPPSNAASVWQDIFSEPIELSTLAEESVSDLLAEVDAMESRCGLASPTSKMNSGENLIEGSKNDCFSSIEGLSPTLDTGKSDALSSTSDIQLPSQSTVTDESLGTSQGDVLDPVKRSGEQSSTSAHMNSETRLGDVPYKHCKAGPSIQPPAPSPVIQNIISSDSAWQADSEAVDTGWGTMKGLRWGGSDQGITNLGWEDANISWPGSAGSIERESHPRYSGERFSAPREGACQSTNLEVSRVRSSWSWQSSSGSGRGGGYSRPSPKGQRLCKFYASGHCKKGALCDYLHR